MTLDQRFFISAPLNQYFVDKDTGLPLAGGTIEFYRDSARTIPKPVYQLTGSPPNYNYATLPNPITLSSVGTVQNNGNDNEVIYFFPFDDSSNIDLYYIVCRNKDGVEQWTREAWPNLTSGSDLIQDLDLQNQISNPQFSRVFINEGVSTTYSVSGGSAQEFEFAPNWVFEISGTGSVVVQRIPIPGNDNIVTGAPYALDVSVSAGITACNLRQRFSTNSGLWSSSGSEDLFIAGLFVARNESPGTAGVDMFYRESSGNPPVNIINGSFDNSGYQLVRGGTVSAMPLSTNTQVGKNSFVDVYLSFPASSNVRITSIQITPNASGSGAELIRYDSQSSNREQALMGDYFIPNLEKKRIRSILTGWDFPLNPAQFGQNGVISGANKYIWDQTIAGRHTKNVTYNRSSVSGGLQFTTTGTNDAFYISQYLTGPQAKEIIGNNLSVNVHAYKSAVGDDVDVKVYLYRAPSSAQFPVLPTTLGVLDSSGNFSLTAPGWTEIPRSGLGTATATLNKLSGNINIKSTDNDYKFTGWSITEESEANDTDKFAIVVTFDYVDASSVITIDSISTNFGNIPTRPEPQTISEVFHNCRSYYETSYNPGVLPGTVTSSGRISRTIGSSMLREGGNVDFRIYSTAFHVEYESEKIKTPNITIYNPTDGASGSVRAIRFGSAGIAVNASIANWALDSNTKKSFNFSGSGSVLNATIQNFPNNSCSGQIEFHYVSDSRLGV